MVEKALHGRAIVGSTALAVVVGMVYCAAHSRLDPQIQPPSVGTAFVWSVTALVPWVAAFEMVKRVRTQQCGVSQMVAATVIIIGTIFVSAALHGPLARRQSLAERVSTASGGSRTARIIADRPSRRSGEPYRASASNQSRRRLCASVH